MADGVGSTVTGATTAKDRIERLGDFSARFGFSRLRREESTPLPIDRKRIYVLPTGFGLFLSLVFIALLMGGLNYNNNPALLWTFLLLAIALNGLLAAHFALSGLRLRRVHAQSVHAGQAIRMECEFDADKPRRRERLELLADGRVHRFDMESDERQMVSLDVSTEERGWMALPRLRVSTTAPMGLVRAWTWLRPDTRLLVYPALEPNAPPLPTGHGSGETRRSQRQGEQPHHLRDYQSGDGLRQIAWKASARADKLMVREYENQQARELRLRWEDLSALNYEHRIQRLARWVVEADKRGLRYALELPQEDIGPDSGDVHRHRCLRALAMLPHA